MAAPSQELPPAYTDSAESAPPKYKARRTRSQEDVYIRELKLWAAEKEKMNPGAYGEYFTRVSEPQHFIRGRQEQQPRSDSSNGAPRPSRPGDAVPEHQHSTRPSHMPDYGIPRRDSVEEMSNSIEASSSAPRVDSFKRRMSSFVKKLGTLEHKTDSTNISAGNHAEHSYRSE